MDGAAGNAESHGFVVFAFEDFDFCRRTKVKAVKKLQKLSVFFVDAEDFAGFVGAKICEKHGALLAQFGDAAAHGDAVGAGFFVAEALDEENFDFWRDGVLETLGFVVGLGPREANDFGE